MTRADLASHLSTVATALRQEGLGLRAASERVARTGDVTAEDWLALAASQDAQVRVPASVLLVLASYLQDDTRTPRVSAGAVGSYLVLLAQGLRREAELLSPVIARVRSRGDGDLVAIVEAVKVGLLEQASMALMIATWMEGSSEVRQGEEELP